MSDSIAITFLASATIALRPSRCEVATCDATPSTDRWNWPTPLRERAISPPSREGSNTKPSCARLASASMRLREPSEPISSSEFTSTVTSARDRSPLSASARSAYKSTTSPPFMSITPGPSARRGLSGSGANFWKLESGSKTVSA
ncbi:MAG: hypothetical protein WEF50_20965 [Myxococcota bacterium]